MKTSRRKRVKSSKPQHHVPAQEANENPSPVPRSLPTGKGWGMDNQPTTPMPNLTQHRHRQASISAILDAMFGDIARQDTKCWDQRTYLLIVGMIYERLAVDEAEIETSELVALAKILSECRRADTGANKQEQKDNSDQTSETEKGNSPRKIKVVVQDVYGAGYNPPANQTEPSEQSEPSERTEPSEHGQLSDNEKHQTAQPQCRKVGTSVYTKKLERADKPNSVSSCRGGDHFSRSTVACRLKRPTHSQASITDAGGGPPHSCLLGLAGGGVYPATTVTGHAVRSYRTISPLPARLSPSVGGIFSVALSLGSRRVGVTNHRALPSSDFPPVLQAS